MDFMVPENKAGIVVLKTTERGYSVLGLKFNNFFDLPKGNIEPYESELDAALRETEEEASITNLDFRWGLQKIKVGPTTFFLATTEQEPMITPNPETGELEHDEAYWLTLEQAKNLVHPELYDAIAWAESMVGIN